MLSIVQNKAELLMLLKANSNKIKSFGVDSLSLFGSFAKDNATSSSDIDLLVNFDPKKKGIDNFIELSFFLEDLLGRKVELVTPQSLSKYIGPHILQQAEHVAI